MFEDQKLQSQKLDYLTRFPHNKQKPSLRHAYKHKRDIIHKLTSIFYAQIKHKTTANQLSITSNTKTYKPI